jgi:hypothetical protein
MTYTQEEVWRMIQEAVDRERTYLQVREVARETLVNGQKIYELFPIERIEPANSGIRVVVR